MMRDGILALALLGLFIGPVARADTSDELRQSYGKFVEAQNAHDLERLKALLLDSPKFLWVSDGKSIWGRDATLKRMAQFQGAEVWRNTPDVAHATAVDVNDKTAFLHLPVELTIGSKAAPGTFRFLVSALYVKNETGWKVAALFTTTEKPE